jgi:hypothetical protein
MIVTLAFEVRRRKRTSFWQFRISELLVVILLVASATAYFANKRRSFEHNQRLLDELVPFVSGASPPQTIAKWRHGGAHWLRNLIGGPVPRWFDTLAVVSAEGTDAAKVAEMRGVIGFVPHGTYSPDELTNIVKIEGLRFLDFAYSHQIQFNDQRLWQAQPGDDAFVELAKCNTLTHLSLHNLPYRESALSAIGRLSELEALVQFF